MAKKPIRKVRRRVPRASLFQRLRNNFLTGLVVVAPVFLTVYLVWVFVAFVDDRVLPWVPQSWNPENILNRNIPGIGVVFFLLGTTVIGYLTKGIFGRQIVRWGENLVDRTPVVRSIYNAVKQIIETIFSQSQQTFQNACLVEYPRKGLWALAFVSTDAKGELVQKLGPAGDDFDLPAHHTKPDFGLFAVRAAQRRGLSRHDVLRRPRSW